MAVSFGAFPKWLVRPVLIVIFLLTPVVTLSLALAACPATLLDCAPMWNDEIHYWNEINCFASVGFNGGYFVADERPAPCPLTHFGPHGPAYPVIYGTLGRIFGWKLWSGPLFNVLLVMLGSAAWVWRCRPDAARLGTAIFLIATFWPCLLFLPSTLQEGLHCAIALLLAALAHSRVNGEAKGVGSIWPFLLAVALASLVRITWVLVLIPWACVALRRDSWRVRIFVLAAIAVAIPGLTVVWRTICAPYPNFLADFIHAAGESPAQALSDLALRTATMFWKFRDYHWGSTLEVVQRFETLGVILLGAWVVLRPGGEDRRAYFFAAANLALITGAVLTLYDVTDWKDFRAIAPHLLLSLLILTSGTGYRWTLRLAAMQLAFAVPFVNQIVENNRERGVVITQSGVEKMRAIFDERVAYDPAESAWGNTILIPVQYHVFTLLAVPPGMGVSFVMDGDGLRLPPKSRYVMSWSPRMIARASNELRLRPLAGGPDGILFLNLDSLPENRRDPKPPPDDPPK
jgi:hypothetical protein